MYVQQGCTINRNLFFLVVGHTCSYSTADTCKNCAKGDKVLKIGPNEANTLHVKTNTGRHRQFTYNVYSLESFIHGSRTKSPRTKPPRTKPPGQNPPDKIPLDKIPPRTKSPWTNPPDKIPPLYSIYNIPLPPRF